MSSSLIPERPLLVSPTLAATIGLHEALLLQTLADLMQHQRGVLRRQRHWVELQDGQLSAALPFWNQGEITNLIRNLMALGLLLREPGSAGPGSYQYALDEKVGVGGAGAVAAETMPGRPTPAAEPAGSSYMSADWQPGADWIRQCRQLGIPEDFIQAQLPQFVQYWRDRGTAAFSWGNKFKTHVLREWRHEQSRRGALDATSPISADWRPGADALEILLNAGVSQEFIEDAVPEFILYWRERDPRAGAWNTKFIDHIRRQWARFSASFGVDDVPRPIPEGWQPSAECYDILQLAEIDEDYARARVPEFVLYWRDSGQARASWNTVFLQFVKQDWARRLQALRETEPGYAENRQFAGANRQRLEEQIQRFTDRSWAE